MHQNFKEFKLLLRMDQIKLMSKRKPILVRRKSRKLKIQKKIQWILMKWLF